MQNRSKQSIHNNKGCKMATQKKKTEGSRVVKGSHLTITYDENNYPVKLEWDDEQLLKDVQAALSSVSTEAAETKVKKTRAKKAKA